MNSYRIRSNFSLVALLLCTMSPLAFSQEFEGIVKDDKNSPVSDVQIRSLSSMRDWSETASDGKFRLQRLPTWLLLIKTGFAPALVQIAKAESHREISIKPAKPGDNISLSACGSTESLLKRTGASRRVGDYFWLPILKNEKVRMGKDVDYQEYAVLFKGRKDTYLHGIWGPHATGVFPFGDWIENAKEIRIRLITFGDRNIGEDWIGRSNAGEDWRFVRVWWEGISYKTSDRAAATFFDKVIDRACYIAR